MDKHTIAAHKIADALDTIHKALNDLDAAASANLGNWIVDLGNGEKLEWTALSVRACAPFEPVSEAEKDELFEQVYEEMCDSHPKDQAWAYMEMEDWQMRAEIDERAEYLKEEDEA